MAPVDEATWVEEKGSDCAVPDVRHLDAALSSGAATSAALTRTALEAAASAEATFTSITEELAQNASRLADVRAARHLRKSPLDGVPVAVKDLFDVRGTRTTAGSSTRNAIAPAERDAALVTALIRAGAVLIGKTTLSEFAYSGLGINPTFGTPPRHVGNTRVVPGGSSSGSATAVAAGIVPVAVATDTSGSARVPAAFCGVVGYKASERRYPRTGMVPLASTLDSVGWIGRSVDDIALADATITGGQGKPPERRSRITLVVPEGELVDDATPEVDRAFAAALDRLRDAGHTVRRQALPVLDEAQHLMDRHATIVAEEAYHRYGHLLTAGTRDRIDPGVIRRLEQYAASPRDATALYRALPVLRHRLRRELGSALLVCPTVRHAPPAIAPLLDDPALYDTANRSSLRTTMLLSYLGMPGISLPITPPGAAPVGLLASGPEDSDTALISAAQVLEFPLR